MYQGETRKWKCENGRTYVMPNTHCVFCKQCTDVIFDSSGAYIFICDLNKELELTETECKCEFFEDNGYVFDNEKYVLKIALSMKGE